MYKLTSNHNFGNLKDINMDRLLMAVNKLSSSLGSPISVYDLYTLCGTINFELINAKVGCKCRNKIHLPVRTVVLVLSVQSERKLCPF